MFKNTLKFVREEKLIKSSSLFKFIQFLYWGKFVPPIVGFIVLLIEF